MRGGNKQKGNDYTFCSRQTVVDGATICCAPPPLIFIILRQSKVSDVINENLSECKYGQQCFQMTRICFLDVMNKRNAHILLIMHH